MALRKETENLQKITTNVFLEDWKWLQETYAKTGASKALRLILRKHKQSTIKKIAEAKNGINAEVELEA